MERVGRSLTSCVKDLSLTATIDETLQAYVDDLSDKSREFCIEDPSVTDIPSVEGVYDVEQVQGKETTVAVLSDVGMIQHPD